MVNRYPLMSEPKFLYVSFALSNFHETDFVMWDGWHTGKSFSEALILASFNPQYDKRLVIEFSQKIQV